MNTDRVVSLAHRRWLRDDFDALLKEGMDLVDAVAQYLDGAGRRESSLLNPRPKVMYRTESMRLTTLLMQLIPWLLAMRSVKEYVMTEASFGKGRQKIRLSRLVRLDVEQMLELPENFFALAQQANTLLEKILKADAEFTQKSDAETAKLASG